TAAFSVPVPATGTAATGYLTAQPKYFAAVIEATAAGANATTSVKFLPTQVQGSQVVVTLPLGSFTNGATIALVQPSSSYGQVVFDAPPTLSFDAGASSYSIPCSATYDIDPLIGQLINDGHTTSNTTGQFIIYPDPGTTPDLNSISLASDIFELDSGSAPSFDSATGELTVPVKLKAGWDSATNLETTLDFNCDLPAANFQEGGMLSLTGGLAIQGGVPGNENLFYIDGTVAQTEMVITRYNVTVNGSYAATTGAGSYPPGTNVAINAGARSGYTFAGWTVNSGSMALANAAAASTSFKMPATDVAVTANWQPVATPPQPPATTYTVRYLPGDHGAFSQVVYSGLALGAPTPSAPAAPGEAGWTFAGWSPAPSATVTGDVAYIAQWSQPVTAYYTVTFVDKDGTVLKTESVPAGGSATPPGNPSLSGYEFTGWSGSYTNVLADTTVTAQYKEVTAPAPNPSTTQPNTPENTSTPSPAPAPPTTPSFAEQAQEEGIFVAHIGPLDIPLTGPDGVAAWALLNLILAILGIVAAVVAAIRFALTRRTGSNADQGTPAASAYRPLTESRDPKKADDKAAARSRRKAIWTLVTIVLALVGIAVFFLTEDIRLPLVFLDRWTILNAAILVAGIVTCIISLLNRKKDDNSSR
ncbi:MAG: InlB B-repeat-containing protein, partial [Eggerthellaceae bacterium]|nr:InlB B-repeat-containing protein [Eggerthellaceae bacterium]